MPPFMPLCCTHRGVQNAKDASARNYSLHGQQIEQHVEHVQVDSAGIDILLVGDSVAMVVHGHDTTLPVTMDDMLVHCKAVSRGARR